MPAKLTEQEFQEVQEIRKSVTEVASVLGDLNYQKITLDLFIEDQKAKIVEIKKRENEFFEKIRSTYGNVSINLDTGDIN